MSAPTPYDRQYSFRTYQAQHPSDPLPGDQVDSELDAIKATTDEVIAALALIQRDDGALANASVGLDQLKSEVSIGVAPAVAWTASTAYAVNDSVFYNLILYRCITAHTSTSTFDATKFTELADLSSIALAPGSVTNPMLGSGAADSRVIADGSVSPGKLGNFPGGPVLFGRFSAATGGVQFLVPDNVTITVDATGILSAAPSAVADNSLTTAKYVDTSVTAAKLASGAAVSNIGYTPLNRAGDTMSGEITRNTKGVYLYHANPAYTSGSITVSSSAPSGGAPGDLWLQVT